MKLTKPVRVRAGTVCTVSGVLVSHAEFRRLKRIEKLGRALEGFKMHNASEAEHKRWHATKRAYLFAIWPELAKPAKKGQK